MNIKPIPGFEGYVASDNGDIYSHWARESLGFGKGSRSVVGPLARPLAAFDRKLIGKKPGGYMSVTMKHADGRFRLRYVHELVLFAFVGPRPSELHEALHRNDNRSDNRPDNLRWGTTQENADDRERAGHVHRGDAWYQSRGKCPPWYRDEEIAVVGPSADLEIERGPFDDLIDGGE